ncbi:DUF2306 domain-containing protein [Sphingomonas sp.]|uniref:DUF2306 domain-containing protein n=1 Tax=Sphingomonas sp. TaxID=28214 RepID=UPI001ECC0173|nr:DUF2306 domain-containing protein [Sphingomonas sp.]MBX3593065.1 DUF2306 domain-containing protein [Sphingomonas sp.]
MTSLSLPRTNRHIPGRTRPRFDLAPVTRALIGAAGIAMSILCAYALIRGLLGLAPSHGAAREWAIRLHLATVLPAVPLGAWVMLARKGTPRHRTLGKLWLVLMVVTALSTLFIRHVNGGSLSWIHLFVPLTLHGAWKTIATARAGNIAKHRANLVGMYLGALMIPGVFAFLPGRLMGSWLLG